MSKSNRLMFHHRHCASIKALAEMGAKIYLPQLFSYNHSCHPEVPQRGELRILRCLKEILSPSHVVRGLRMTKFYLWEAIMTFIKGMIDPFQLSSK